MYIGEMHVPSFDLYKQCTLHSLFLYAIGGVFIIRILLYSWLYTHECYLISECILCLGTEVKCTCIQQIRTSSINQVFDQVSLRLWLDNGLVIRMEGTLIT